MQPDSCLLQLLVSSDACLSRPAEVVREAIRGGVDLVQVREKGVSTRERIRRARPILEVARELEVAVLINDDVEAAAALPVQGVHLGQHDTDPWEARRRLGEQAWIGLSTHGPEEVASTARLPVTHLGLGACFATATKRDHRVLDREALASALAISSRPVFAIGGITLERLEELVPLGVRRVAVSAAILESTDPSAAAAALRARLEAIRGPDPGHE